MDESVSPGDAVRDGSSNSEEQTTSVDREAKKDAVEEEKGSKSSGDDSEEVEICDELGVGKDMVVSEGGEGVVGMQVAEVVPGIMSVIGGEKKDVGEDCEGEKGRREGVEVAPSGGEFYLAFILLKRHQCHTHRGKISTKFL